MGPPLTSPQLPEWTLSDGYALRGRLWVPSRQVSSQAVIFLHGIQSHGGWFEWSASLLAKQGCVVILPDRRGSGLNSVARGDTPSAERWLADVDELAAWAQDELGVGRFDLVGVSWGGKLALAWALQNAAQVRRLLLIGPGLFPAVDISARTRLQVGLSLLAGGGRMFAIPLDDPALFTDNPVGREFIASDPLKLTQATARFFWASRRLDRRLLRTPAGALEAPTTLVLAGRDQIIRNRPTKAWIERVTDGNAQVATFAKSAHTLEFSADRAPLSDLIGAWVSGGVQVPG